MKNRSLTWYLSPPEEARLMAVKASLVFYIGLPEHEITIRSHNKILYIRPFKRLLSSDDAPA